MIFDTGALIAAERDDRRFWVLYELARRQSVVPIVLTPVLTEVWRGGARQARLSIALRGCKILAPDERLANAAGVLLAKSHSDDPVDALVAALGAQLSDLVVTGDEGDLRHLAAFAKGCRIKAL